MPLTINPVISGRKSTTLFYSTKLFSSFVLRKRDKFLINLYVGLKKREINIRKKNYYNVKPKLKTSGTATPALL